MRSKLLTIAGALLVATGLTSSPPIVAAPTGDSVPTSQSESAPRAWFVQLSGAPTRNAAGKKTLQAEHAAFRKAAKQAGVAFEERRSFDTLWNGLSITTTAGNIRTIRGISGVTGVWPVITIDAPEQNFVSHPDLVSAITMTGADIAQDTLGFTGAGVKVAVMDTGIDVDNSDFGGDDVPRNNSELFPSERVAYGYDFVGDAYNADPDSPTYNPVPNPDPNPDDCQGHGTHVAGIVGANGATIKGVAPGVTLGAYRVFGCDGSTDADIMIAAMEMALADGMDILNMSIGSSFQWPQYPTAVAASRMVDEGMVVVASIGNSGTSGLYAAGAPGLGDKVIGTASVDNIAGLGPYFDVNGTEIPYNGMSFAGPIPTSGSSEYVYVGLACNVNPLEADPDGITALISRGGCSFNEKATNAINAGATAVVIHNNSPGNFNGTLGTPIDGVTPVVSVSLENGTFMRAQAVPAYLTWTDQLTSSPIATGGLISSFSSYGLSPDLALKPDIAAPGGVIYSSYPLEKGGHATLGGTSMASPHVAGAAALVLQAKPETSAEEMRSLLQNSADPSLLVIAPFPGLIEPVHRQGAGTVDIDDAILATTLVTPGKISAGEGEAGPHITDLTIRNDGSSDVTYELFYEGAIATSGLTTDIDWWFDDATVDFDRASITVPAGGSAGFRAIINPASYPDPDLGAPFGATDFGLYGGYITLVPQDGGEVVRVPYAGFVGDYQRIEHMSPGAYGMPWLTVLIDDTYYKVDGPEDWVYSMEGDDVPYFLIHFDHQVEYLEAKVYEAGSGVPVHPVFNTVFDFDYLPRNASATGFFSFGWDGERLHSNGLGHVKKNGVPKTKTVPDGVYTIEIRALKANGDRNNPAHWESWISPTIAIDRP